MATKSSKQTKKKNKLAQPAQKPPTIVSHIQTTKGRINNFLTRRPHHSFRRTMRRDYIRSLKLPGYISFTGETIGLLKLRWKTFGLLIVIYALATVLLAGIASQDVYTELAATLAATSEGIFEGGWGEIGKAGLLLATGVSGGFMPELTEAQQIFSSLLLIFTWLTTVWLLRAQLSGGRPKLRDGMYNAGAPIIPTTLIAVLIVLQLIPMALAIIGYNAALTTDFLTGGIVAMIFFLVALLLIVLSLYLITSTFFALIVVTLPGMYPWQALRTAGDLVTGRRVRILLRLIWMLLVILVTWAIIMIPMVLFTSWLQTTVMQIAWIPIVPVVLTMLSSASVVFASSYIYLLYRKVIDDDAKPA